MPSSPLPLVDDSYHARLLAAVNTNTLVPERSSRICRAMTEVFDIVVVGGGIHGVCVAKMAAQAGLSVLLLERDDYASGTSSRSSKMAHGGLRYLEMCDFEQVYEGIRAREALFEHVPNLVRPERFLIPVSRRDIWFRWKLGVGLAIYDLAVRKQERKHSWIKGTPDIFGGGDTLAGCYQYTDGLMSDTRLVFDFLTSAHSFGCCALNYAMVEDIREQGDSTVVVHWSDLREHGSYSTRARLVVNCAGPWSPALHPCGENQEFPQVKYSRGSHLVFSVPWPHPSLFLPLEEKGRYYFVWPHPSGTMVGTTEREVQDLQADPVPSPDEISEVLARVARDLPHAGLTRETLCYVFAGVRTLPLRHEKHGVSQLSRKHIWSFSGGVLTLVGGKYTTFAWTATQGLRLALSHLGVDPQTIPDPLAALPSAHSDQERAKICEEILGNRAISVVALNRAVQRLGRLVFCYRDRDEAWHEVFPGVLMLEVLHAIECEQAHSIEDVVRRRLELEATPSHGLEALDAIEAQLSKLISRENLKEQRREFVARMELIDSLCWQSC